MGYPETLIGGLAGLWVPLIVGGVIWLNAGKGTDELCASAADPVACVVAVERPWAMTALLVAVAACGFVPAGWLRSRQCNAEVETGVAAAVAGIVYLVLTMALVLAYASAPTIPFLALPAWVLSLPLMLPAARWFALAWHRRRCRAQAHPG